MTEQTPITNGGSNRRYKQCKCGQCGTVRECVPNFDFYTLEGDDDGLLQCENCFRDHMRNIAKLIQINRLTNSKSD